MRGLIFTTVFVCLATGLFATQDKKQVKLRLQGPNGQVDQTTIYFDEGISSTYVPDEDAIKIYSGLEGVPVIYSLTNEGRECSINGFSTLATTETVGYGVDVDLDGLYTFTTPLFDGFDATTIVRLEDRQTGIFTDLRTNFYQANILADEVARGRFFLHVSTPITVGSSLAGCLNNDGIITATASDNSITWSLCELYNADNELMGSYTDVNGLINFDSLAAGEYHLVFVYGSYTTTKTFSISTTQIIAEVEASKIYAYTYEDLTFHAIADNANRFEWDFGEGTWIVGVAHPTMAFYEPGTYTVTMNCSNQYGCHANADIEVHIEQAISTGINDDMQEAKATVTTIGKTLTVNMNTDVTEDATINVFNLLGQNIYNSPVSSIITNISFDEQPAGYYLVAVKNGAKVNTSKIYIK